MKSKKLLLTALVALAVPFGTLSGGVVKAEGPNTAPEVTPKTTPTWDTETPEEAKKAEDTNAKKAEDKYKELTATHEKGQPLVNDKPEYKLPAATQTPKKQVKPVDKNVKKALPKTSAVK